MTNQTAPPNTPPLPNWLPGLLSFHGDWEAFLRVLYSIFSIDFKSGSLKFKDRPVWYDQRIDASDSHGYEEGFWHLVTRYDFVWNPRLGRKEKQRLPDIQRARYLPWGCPTIENEGAPEVMVWNFDEETRKGRVVRTYLWLREWDYVVVLERQEKSWGEFSCSLQPFPLIFQQNGLIWKVVIIAEKDEAPAAAEAQLLSHMVNELIIVKQSITNYARKK